MEETLYTRNNLIVAFLIGLIIGLGGYYLWDNRPGGDTSDNTAPQAETGSENGGENTQNGSDKNGSEVEFGANSVQTPDQPAGLRVILDSISVDQNSWVAVHEDMNGSVSPVILGAARFDGGDYTDEVVNLLRNTEESNTYYVVIHADDGDKEFNPENDTPITGSQGTPVMDSFRVIPVR